METIPIAIAIDPLSFSLLGIIILSTESSTKNKWIYENDFKNFKNATWQNVYQLSNPVWWRLDFSNIN